MTQEEFANIVRTKSFSWDEFERFLKSCDNKTLIRFIMQLCVDGAYSSTVAYCRFAQTILEGDDERRIQEAKDFVSKEFKL